MKKSVAVLVSIVCAVLLLVGVAMASGGNTPTPPTSGTCGANLTWTYAPDLDANGVDRGGTLTISGTGNMEDFEHDPWWNTAPWRSYSVRHVAIENGVTSVGSAAFSCCKNLTDIKLPASITQIGQYAFFDCGITSITIPNSVTQIGEHAFESCKTLGEVSLPARLKQIKYQTFAECESLTSLQIPDGVLYIEANAFMLSGLKNVDIPASTIRIDNESFSKARKLTEITVDTNNQQYASEDGALLNKEKSEIILCPRGKIAYTIPASVSIIGPEAFRDCLIKDITISDNITTINQQAFASSQLSSVILPESITSIGSYVFAECTGITNAEIRCKTNIGSSMFAGCSALTKLYVYNGVTAISAYAFNDCINLSEITIPPSVKKIASNAFKHCDALKTITYTGTSTQWGEIEIKDGNQELGLAKIVCTGTDSPTTPDNPNPPSTPDAQTLSVTSGGLGKKVTVELTGGHWLTIQVRRAGSISITSVQAPGSGKTTLTFSAPVGSTVQTWETEEEMTFTNGVPDNKILATATREL